MKAGVSAPAPVTVASDDEEVRSPRMLLFEEGRNLLLPDEKSPGCRHSVEQTRPRGHSVRRPTGNFSPAFLRDLQGF
jgi:hypothetical protein